VIPFTAAAHEHTEPAFDVTGTPGTSAVQLGPFDVPAFGFLRHIYLEVTGATGNVSGGNLAADYPFNVIQSISLNDVNGAPIFGPLDGYALAQSNIWGGYGGQFVDPRLVPWFVSTINCAFGVRIPVEISHHNGMGALANQNAAAAYKVNITLNTLANIVSGGSPTAPAIRIRGFLEAWTLPNETDVAGRPQGQVPYAHGTTQYWSQFIKSVSAGANTTLLPRVGNLIRNVLVIARNGTIVNGVGTRDDNVFPNPPILAWDARNIFNDTQNYRVERMKAVAPITSGGRDTGVFVYPWGVSPGNSIGDDDPTFWLPTVQSTRLELDGSSVSAGTLQVITNDVAPVEVVPQERFVETSQSGFHPNQGVATPGAL